MERRFSRQSRHFIFIDKIIEVLFPNCTLTWRVNNYASHQGRGIKRKIDDTIIQESYYHFFNQLTINIDTGFYFEELYFVGH